MLDPFFADVLCELARIDRRQAPYASLAHARDALHVELALLRLEMNRPAEMHSRRVARLAARSLGNDRA